ncbi:MAG: CD1871A family CXXC motif-containing protein [Eubacteriales bacterium]
MKYIGNNSFKIRQLLRILLIGIGISFIYIGANRGEVSAVFDKAIRLCLECVGIG